MIKNLHIKIILGLTAILFLLYCSTSCSREPADNKIKIGIPAGPSVISFIQMIEKDYKFDNKEIEFIIRSTPEDIQAMMKKNQLDFAILPTPLAVNLYNKGMEYRMVSCPAWGSLHLVSRDDEIHCLDDLHEKELHIFGRNNTPDILIRHNINQRAIDCKVNYNYNTCLELSQALLNSEVNTAILTEPLISIICEKDPSIRVVERIKCQKKFDTTEDNGFMESTFLVSNRFINHNSHLISKICEAYANSCNFVNENPQEAAKLLVKHKFARTNDIAEKSIELSNIQYVAAFALYRDLYTYLQIFHSIEPQSIGGKMPELNFIYQTY